VSDVHALYIVRHAIAEERGEAYPDDELRPLSAKGMAKFRKAAKGLAKFGVTVDHVLSSPLVRARQTADILVEEIGGRPEIVETRALTPEASYEKLREALESCARGGIRGDVGCDDLDRDISLQAMIPRAIDFSHPAGADARDEVVRTESAARGRWHVCEECSSLRSR
jgi:hypothetical protein